MRIAIGSPLDAQLVERIAAAGPHVEIDYQPELLPPLRYPCDHRGPPEWRRDAAREARWEQMLGRADVLFGTPGDSGPTLSAALALAPKLVWCAATAAGAGEWVRAAHLPAEMLERIAFTNAAGIHGGMLAEFVFAGLLALRKDFARLARIRAARGWDHYASGELAGSRLAIVGVGGIGRAIAVRARAFDMHVTAISRTKPAPGIADDWYPIERLREAFGRADAVAVTLPGTESTRHLIDAAALAALPEDAIFCNVGRGTVVDQAALIAALEAGRLSGAVLDVSDPEPLPAESPLWTMERVVFAPHTMALSVHENARIVDLFCDNIERFAAGLPLRNRIDVREFY